MQSISIITVYPHSPFKVQNEFHIGMPMGYGTIASNGATHGSKAQTIYNYKPKIYTQSQGKHDFTHGHKPLKHLIETQVCNIKREGEIETHSIKPQPSNKSKCGPPKRDGR